MSARGRLEGEMFTWLDGFPMAMSNEEWARALAGWIIGPGRDVVLAALSSCPPTHQPADPVPDRPLLISSICQALAKEHPPRNHGLTAAAIVTQLIVDGHISDAPDSQASPQPPPVLASRVDQLEASVRALGHAVSELAKL